MSSPAGPGTGTPDTGAFIGAGNTDEPVQDSVMSWQVHRLAAWARRHRALALAVPVLLLAVVITAANALAAPKDGRALSAGNPGAGGAQALARILGSHGVAVRPVDDYASAISTLSGHSGATLLLYDAGSYLNGSQLQRLSGLAGRTVVVAPSFTTLQGLDAGVHQAGVVPDGTAVLEPGCDDTDAVAAGPVLAPGAYLYSGHATCYAAGTATNGVSGPGVLAHNSAGDIIVLGDGQLMSNSGLAMEGNAALSIRTVGTTDVLVWYLPSFTDLDSPGAPVSLNELAPAWTHFLGPWLLLVAVLAMLWRGRRLGPLVFEPLPVNVLAGETAYGRARLYHDARALDLVRDNLRAGTLVRLARHFRLGPDASAADVARRTASFLDLPESSVLHLLDEKPAGEARLVQWAQELSELEQKVAER